MIRASSRCVAGLFGLLLAIASLACSSDSGDGSGSGGNTAADTTAPSVSLTNPGNSDTGTAITATISAAFSEPVDASTLTTATMSVAAGGVQVAGSVNVNGNTATFTPSGPLSPGTLHTVTITTGARDLAGNSLATPYVWHFTTASSGTSDTTAPTVVSTSPVDLATGVALGAVISVTFSKAMDPSTLTTATMTVSVEGTPVSGNVTLAGATATFTPSGPLAEGMVHTVTVTTGARDLAGNGLASDMVWQFATMSPWQMKASMPTPRTEFGVAVANGKIYAIGGFSGSTLAFNEEYNPATDSWTTKAPMANARRLFVTVEVNGKIYAIGGMSFTNPNSATYVTATEEYDPVADTWTLKAPLPMDPPVNNVVGNVFMGGTSAGGKVYVFIFNTNTAGTSATYEYDPASNTWDKVKAPVPMTYTQYSAAALNGNIYTLATDAPGFWNSSFVDGTPFAKYDPVQDFWTILQPTKLPRRLQSLTAVNGRVLAVGGLAYAGSVQGLATFTEIGDVEAYDPGSGQWMVGPLLAVPRQSPGVAAVGNTVYVIGGGTANAVPLSTVEALTIN